jgi:adenosylhomocysteine nucleosidase
MARLLLDTPCILFALRREARALLRTFSPQQPLSGAPCRARLCGLPGRMVLMLETGIGAERTRMALEWLLDNYRPKLVLSAGFCGALDEDLQVGDLILATEIVDTQSRIWPTTWPDELTRGRAKLVRRGRLLTVSRMLTTPAEKEAHYQRWSAAAVDMESALVAQGCSQAGIPFGGLRAVSDDAHTALSPRLASLLTGSRASAFRLLAALARSPRLAGELWRLARQTHLAADRLGQAFAELLPLALSERRDGP